MPTDTAPMSSTEQELKMVRIALTARGWTCAELRQDGDTYHLYAKRTFPHQDLTIREVDAER